MSSKIKTFSPIKAAGLAAACAVIVFAGGVNASPAFAESLKGIPVLGSAAEFFSLREYANVTDKQEIVIDRAELDGMTNKDLENSLNSKYAAQAKQLYDEYLAKIDGGVEHISMLSGYSVKADNGATMSVEHSIFTAQASGAQSYEYDTIDTVNEVYITLPGLFKDDSYIDLISTEVKRQMTEQTAADSSRVFYTDASAFDKISSDQQFYIDNDHHLVIVFDEYAVAPGVMGALEFTIPTSVIQGALAGNHYIQ